MLISDYRCPAHGTFEAVVPSPIPDHHVCPVCGDAASRRFTTAGLSGTAPRPAEVLARSPKADAVVPGLCAAPADARTSVIARYVGDNDTLASEQKRQTRRFEECGPPTADMLAPGCRKGAHPH